MRIPRRGNSRLAIAGRASFSTATMTSEGWMRRRKLQPRRNPFFELFGAEESAKARSHDE
jgi:hypothetical protein